MKNPATLFRINPVLKEKAEELAKKRGLNFSGWLRMLIVLEIEKENEKNIAKCISNDI